MAAPRRGRLRGGRPCGTTALRCAVRARTAELAPRPAAVPLRHAAVSQKGGRAGARRARGLVLLATASYAGPGGAQPPLAVTTSTGQTNRPLPYCGPAIRNAAISCLPWHGVSREIRVPCTGSGPIRGRGEQRRRRGGARSRASTSDSRPLSERSVPAGREVSWPCAPAPSSATQSARRADRTPGPEPVQGTRISCATFFARAQRARTTCPNVCEAFTLQTERSTALPRPRQGIVPDGVVLPAALAAFVAGVIALQQGATLPAPWMLATLGGAACSALFAARFLPHVGAPVVGVPAVGGSGTQGARVAAIVLAAAALGFAYAGLRAHVRLAETGAAAKG